MNAQTKQCFAHHFMTFEEYGLWTYAREVSHKLGIFYFDGPGVAARFNGQSKNTPYRIANSLAHKGFFRLLKKAKRDRKTGIFKTPQIENRKIKLYMIISSSDRAGRLYF